MLQNERTKGTKLLVQP